MDSNKSLENKKEKKFETMKNKNYLDDINSKYVVALIFKNLIRGKALKIIKYSKKMQNRMELNIKNYKAYSEKLSQIEIEIIPNENQYCKIIHILNDEEKKYYHIYLNNNKEEIKRNYLNKSDDITNLKIKVEIDNQVKSLSKLFIYCKHIKSICFKRFRRNYILDMSEMFKECSSLKEINFLCFNSENVSNMKEMFSGCSSLKELNLSNFNTENVIDMCEMFRDCSLIEKINLSSFDTKNVINMYAMFLGCGALKELNISNFNTCNVTDIHAMFFGCASIKELIFLILIQIKSLIWNLCFIIVHR